MKLETKNLTTVGILGSIVIMLGLTPLGFIPLGMLSITSLHIPVIILPGAVQSIFERLHYLHSYRRSVGNGILFQSYRSYFAIFPKFLSNSETDKTDNVRRVKKRQESLLSYTSSIDSVQEIPSLFPKCNFYPNSVFLLHQSITPVYDTTLRILLRFHDSVFVR